MSIIKTVKVNIKKGLQEVRFVMQLSYQTSDIDLKLFFKFDHQKAPKGLEGECPTTPSEGDVKPGERRVKRLIARL